MIKNKIAYVSSEWYSDTDLSLLHFLSLEYDIDWIYTTNTYNPRVPINIIKEYSHKNKICIHILPANYKYLNIKNVYLYWKLYKILYNGKYDLIYMEGSLHLYRIPFEFFIKKDKKIIQGIHDVIFHSGIRGLYIFKLSYKWMFNNRKYFCVFSKTQFDIFRQLYPKKVVEMVGMSVKNMGKPTVSQPDWNDGIRLLFFGRIDYYKGLDILISALEDVYSQGIRNIHLTISGTGKYWKECESKIIHKQLYTLNIRFIETNEIANMIVSNHFLVLPYRDSTQSGPLMIAANYGLPIIAPRLESFLSVYNEDAGLFYNKGKLKECLLFLSSMSRIDYNSMRIASRKIQSSFSEQVIASNYIRYFNSIINKKS